MMINLNETIRVSFDLFDAETVVLQTIPIMNNLNKLSDVQALNKYIWQLAQEFNKLNEKKTSFFHDGTTKRKRILVMDLYAFNIHLFLQNSMQVGLISTDFGATIEKNLSIASNYEEFIDRSMALDFLMTNTTKKCFDPKKRLCQKVGHACLDLNCTKSSAITSDGMHYCSSILGGRINAALACLLKCRYSSNGSDVDFLEKCMFQCNKKILSIEPIQWTNSHNVSVSWRYTDPIGAQNFTESVVTEVKNFLTEY